jgi:hypothetical protein
MDDACIGDISWLMVELQIMLLLPNNSGGQKKTEHTSSAAGSLQRALDVLAAQAGTQLDAEAVAAFLGCSPRADNLLSMQSPLAPTTTWR